MASVTVFATVFVFVMTYLVPILYALFGAILVFKQSSSYHWRFCIVLPHREFFMFSLGDLKTAETFIQLLHQLGYLYRAR